jgi:hypothetical protein
MDDPITVTTTNDTAIAEPIEAEEPAVTTTAITVPDAATQDVPDIAIATADVTLVDTGISGGPIDRETGTITDVTT